jgi:hypothetical protein
MTLYLSICALIFVCMDNNTARRMLVKVNALAQKCTKILGESCHRKKTGTERECGIYCVRDGSCESVNYKISGISKGLCELNSKTLQEASADDQETNPEFNHLHVIKKDRKLNIILYCCTRARK